jgi:hypothetical protein
LPGANEISQPIIDVNENSNDGSFDDLEMEFKDNDI